LSGGLEAIAKLKEKGVSAKHILVTREHSMVGWKLWDLAWSLGLSSDIRIFQSGMPFKDLYVLFCAADVYMSCSKGEGLGLPVMEAMSVGIPVVANSVGALPELLGWKGLSRGFLVPSKFTHIDPFGNQNRRYVDRDKMAENLLNVKKMYDKPDRKLGKVITDARDFVESRTWERPARQIEEAIKKIGDEE
jgi:glycosyltransferase involved in cell wall biosynthesis